MSDTAASLPHQLALVKAQLEEKTEESNTFRRQLAEEKILVQQLRGQRELPAPAPEKVSTTHDKPPSSAAGSERATPIDDAPTSAPLSHTEAKPAPVPLPRVDEKHRPGNLRSTMDSLYLYHDPNAPLLFPHEKKLAGRKKKTPKAKGKQYIPIPPTENMMKTHYPMFVLPVRALLRLERLLPHQDMLERSLLLPYNQFTMNGRVIFVSHQCTSICNICVVQSPVTYTYTTYPASYAHTHTRTHSHVTSPITPPPT